MALIRCPECKKKVSDQAETCPHCGIKLLHNSSSDLTEPQQENVQMPIEGSGNKQEKKSKQGTSTISKIIIAALGVVVIFFAIVIFRDHMGADDLLGGAATETPTPTASATATNTPRPTKTASPTPKPTPTPTPTPEPTLSPEEIEAQKAEYVVVPYNDVARNPDNYIGEKLLVSGKVIQVQESDESQTYRIAQDSDYDKVYVVRYIRKEGESRILEDDIVNAYIACLGDVTYTTIMGGKVTVPAGIALAIDVIG